MVVLGKSWADYWDAGGSRSLPGKSQVRVVIGFLRNTAKDPLEKVFDP